MSMHTRSLMSRNFGATLALGYVGMANAGASRSRLHTTERFRVELSHTHTHAHRHPGETQKPRVTQSKQQTKCTPQNPKQLKVGTWISDLKEARMASSAGKPSPVDLEAVRRELLPLFTFYRLNILTLT